MTPYHEQTEYRLFNADCMDALKALPDNSIDSCVVDGPYGIRFMGKAWDGADIERTHALTLSKNGHSGIATEAGRYNRELYAARAFQAFSEAWAREVFRVLKPGAYLASFCSTRTYHRMAAGIEDAGFEVRDQIAWTFGSGFPKSLNVSKAIDGADKIGTSRERSLKFTAFMRSTGLTSKQINEATESSMASHYLTAKEQPEIATEEMFAKLRPLIAQNCVEIPDEIEQLVAWRTVESENLKKRRVIRQEQMADFANSRPVSAAAQGLETIPRRLVNVTAAHTEEAKEWEGHGTALKPAWEPICLARKPLEGTVADNVRKWGTGTLNIDGCRIESEILRAITRRPSQLGTFEGAEGNTCPERQGRWPANLCHDGSDEVVAMFPTDGEEGSARFFYCAKADRTDRDEGLDGIAARVVNEDTPPDSPGARSPRAGAGRNAAQRNFHPTVKPTSLMRWLVRLVTPPGGKVLDHMMGSGSTGKACVLEGFHFTGIEREAQYMPINAARIAYAIDHRERWDEIHAPEANGPQVDVPGQTLLFG